MRRLLVVAGLCAYAPTALASEDGRPSTVPQATTPSAAPDACIGVAARNRAPDYPIDMLVSGRAGMVVLAITIDTCGRATAVKIQKSSGYTAFDKAAVGAAGHWTLTAAERATAVDGVVIKPVEFKVDD